jgi:hypothetical protein
MSDLDKLTEIILKARKDKTDPFIVAMQIIKYFEEATECAFYMKEGNWTKGSKKDVENFRKFKTMQEKQH